MVQWPNAFRFYTINFNFVFIILSKADFKPICNFFQDKQNWNANL